VVDLCSVHAADYADWNAGSEAYFKRYFIGHYNPLGNFFCAFAMKDHVVAMLNPKPLPYR